MKDTFISAADQAIVMLLLNQPEMKDWFFCAVIIAFTIGLPYLTFLTIREERRARVQMPPFSPSPPVQASLPPSNAFGLLPPSSTQQDKDLPTQAASKLPAFLDISPEHFAIYFEAYERAHADLLGLKPGEQVPPLNSKASHRKGP